MTFVRRCSYALRKAYKTAWKSRKENKMKTQPNKNRSAQDTYRKGILMIALLVLCATYLESQIIDPNLPAPSTFPETFYLKENARNRKPEAYVHENESDVMWSKRVWRTIDLREKFNHPIYFPETPINDRKSLFDVIKAGLFSGEIYAFDNPVFDDEFKVKMSNKQIKDMFFVWDSTQTAEDPLHPGTFIPNPQMTALESHDIKQYWVKEDWFFDNKRSIMDVRILGLCPLKEKLDPSTGEWIGVEPLFWIYFPQCRNLFAKSEVFNTKNDAQRITYDDLFSKRMFSSYIRKESNVMDRDINSYASGVDAILESDRVKDDIFKMEHDMWHL